jgi:hypothetical protein
VRGIRFTQDGEGLLVGGGPRALRLFDPSARKDLWEGSTLEAQALLAAAGAQEAQPGDPAGGKGEAAPQPVPPPRQWPEKVDISFARGLKAYPELSLFGPEAEAVASVGPEGLRLTLPAGREVVQEAGAVGVEWQRVLRGDFEITLAYELIDLPRPGPQWGAGAVLDATFDEPVSPQVRLSRTQKAGGPTFGSTYYGLDNTGGRRGQGLKYPRANENVRTGRLRLVRSGTVVAFQVDEGGAGFRTIASREVGGADVVSVRAFATSGEQALPVDLRFRNLELRWDPGTKIAGANAPGGEGAGRQWPRGWLAALLLIVLLGLSVAGVVLAVSRRRANWDRPRETPPGEPGP